MTKAKRKKKFSELKAIQDRLEKKKMQLQDIATEEKEIQRLKKELRID